jgi:methyl-accepting chemotaxis protein
MNTTAGMSLRGRLIAWLLLVALLICCLSGLALYNQRNSLLQDRGQNTQSCRVCHGHHQQL